MFVDVIMRASAFESGAFLELSAVGSLRAIRTPWGRALFLR